MNEALFTVDVDIIILGENPLDGARSICSLSKESVVPPTYLLERADDPAEVARFLCKKYLDVDSYWIKLLPLHIINNNGNIKIFFIGMIPLDTKPKEAYFVSAQKITDINIIKAMSEYEMV